MATAELLLGFVDEAALRREYDANLRHGRAFVAGATGVDRLAPCLLKIVRADTLDILMLDAQVVLVSDAEPMRGVAVQINSGEWREQLAQFVGVPLVAKQQESKPVTEPLSPVPDHPAVEEDRATADGSSESEGSSSDQGDQGDDQDQDPNEAGSDRDRGDNVYAERRQRIKKMSAADRGRVAHGSSIDDRVLLERIFGPSVWEMLLHSTTLTPPEVANIARKGSLSIPLLELISDNQNWIRQDIVRRALLGNPRTPPHCIMKVLHAMPKSELKMVAEGATTYPAKVRSILQTLKGRRS